MWDFMKLDKLKSKSISILCDSSKKDKEKEKAANTTISSVNSLVGNNEKNCKHICNNKVVWPKLPDRNLSPGVDLNKQHQIMEYRRRGGKPRPKPAGQVVGANGGGGSGFGFGQTTVGWNVNSTQPKQESHTECRKRESQLKQELDTHVKYMESQTVALQQMEQTIAYQYAIIQQLTQQMEAEAANSAGLGGPSSSSNNAGGGDPLAMLTKQFEAMAAGQGGENSKRSGRRARRTSSSNNGEGGEWLK